jgi:hypothetical protein
VGVREMAPEKSGHARYKHFHCLSRLPYAAEPPEPF